MARIGVEESLSDVKDALVQAGHEVIDLHSEEDASGCDCCVITGLDKDMMGNATASIEGPVINAQGNNADAICQMVDERLT